MMKPIILPRISDQKPLVSVISITYNHEAFIRDCVEGFLLQKIVFPIEIIIHDDASTDHTADILREYYEKRPDVFHMIIEQENQFSQGKDVCRPLFEEAQGKYIAFCEGDDYWTDPFKLQKQFDIMESNMGYSGCFHNYTTLYCNSNTLVTRKNIYRKKKEIDLKTAIRNGTKDIHLCSIFFRKKAIKDYEQFKANSPVGDYPLQICLANSGLIYYIDESMCVYRKGFQGSWSVRANNLYTIMDHIDKMILWLKKIEDLLGDKESFEIAIGGYLFYKAKLQRQAIMIHESKELKAYYNNQGIKRKILIMLYNTYIYIQSRLNQFNPKKKHKDTDTF